MKMIIDAPKLKEVAAETEKQIIKQFKECTGFALFWDLGEHASSSIHGINPVTLAAMVKSVFDSHPQVKLLLAMTGEIKL